MKESKGCVTDEKRQKQKGQRQQMLLKMW